MYIQTIHFFNGIILNTVNAVFPYKCEGLAYVEI